MAKSKKRRRVSARPEDTQLEKFGCKYPLILLGVILVLIIFSQWIGRAVRLVGAWLD